MQTVQGGYVSEMKTVDRKSEGSAYLYDDYRPGQVVFLSGDSLDVMLNLNIQNSNVEVLINEVPKFANQNQVKKISVRSEQEQDVFVYENLKIEDEDYTGLAQLIYEANSFSVFEVYKYRVKEGYYVPALDVGSNSIQHIISDRLIMNADGQNYEISLRNKKRFARSLPFSEDKVVTYIKDNRLSIKEEKDLLKIFQYIDSNK